MSAYSSDIGADASWPVNRDFERVAASFRRFLRDVSKRVGFVLLAGEQIEDGENVVAARELVAAGYVGQAEPIACGLRAGLRLYRMNRDIRLAKQIGRA